MPVIKRVIVAGELHWAAAVLFKQIFCIHCVDSVVLRLRRLFAGCSPGKNSADKISDASAFEPLYSRMLATIR